MSPRIPLVLGASLALCSCNKQDKALLAEYNDQQAEIADLESQINRINRKLTENHLKDPAGQVEELNNQLAAIEAEKNVLLEEIAATKEETKQAAEELEQYRIKYPVKSN